MSIAFIPARGGSKRIPGKNLKLLDGKPLISYSIEAVKSCGLFQDIIVSSDSEEILDFSRSLGVSALKRHERLSDDYSTISDVTRDYIRSSKHANEDVVCCVLPSNPFTLPSSLVEAFQRISDWDYVFTIVESQKPLERALIRDDSGFTRIKKPEFQFTRTQDLAVTYFDAGQFYFSKAGTWMSEKSILNSRSFGIELAANSVIDIDTIADWQLAEFILKNERGVAF